MAEAVSDVILTLSCREVHHMPRYTVTPIDDSCTSAELISQDAAAVLPMVARLDCGEADVLEDGNYAFSLQLGASGLWQIYQRNEANKKYLSATG